MRRRDYQIGLVLLLVAASLPFWLIQTEFILNVATLTFIYMATSSAWNIISGFGGQTSFGHSIFFGIGAYAPALMFSRLHINTWIAILVGAILATFVATLIGALTFRARGIYFALATFALTLIFEILAVHFASVTEGDVGVTASVLGGNDLAQFQFDNDLWYYYVAIGLAATFLIVGGLVLRSRLGLSLRGVRDDEAAARASGVRALRVKLMGLGLSAFLAALTGSVYFEFVGFIDPSSAFGAATATQIAVIAIVGGAGTIWGPVLGAALLVPLEQVLSSSLSSFPPGFNLVAYAAVVIAILWVEPRGLVTLLTRAVARSSRGGASGPPSQGVVEDDSPAKESRSTQVTEGSYWSLGTLGSPDGGTP